MRIDHIIVQAGGKGTRFEYLTANKPKALVPVDNLPILFHLFRGFPDKRFVIIADYKREVFREYLESFANVKYQVVDASGTGTCAGLAQAMECLPDGEPFMLIWSDLILSPDFELPNERGNYIGLSRTFPCRWKFERGAFAEERSEEYGVAGLFIFEDKSALDGVRTSGEFVCWLNGRGIAFKTLGLAGTREFGVVGEYEKLARAKTRPFNKMTVEGNTLTKEPIDEQGRKLARLERKWYETATAKGIRNIPRIYSTEPLKMERIDGKNIYEYEDLSLDAKREILRKLTGALKNLHAL